MTAVRTALGLDVAWSGSATTTSPGTPWDALSWTETSSSAARASIAASSQSVHSITLAAARRRAELPRRATRRAESGGIVERHESAVHIICDCALERLVLAAS